MHSWKINNLIDYLYVTLVMGYGQSGKLTQKLKFLVYKNVERPIWGYPVYIHWAMISMINLI